MRGNLTKFCFLNILNAILLLSGHYMETPVGGKQLQFRDFVPRSTMQSPSALQTAQIEVEEGFRRKSRGFQFSSDEDSINVEFEVFVPLVQLPIESSLALLKKTVRKAANLNIDALGTLLAFIILGGSFILVLKLFGIYTAKFKSTHKSRRQLRTIEGFNNTNQYQVEPMNEKDYYYFGKHYFGNTWTESEPVIRNCLQYYLCGEIKKIANDTRTGQGGSYQKIIDGLISLQIMQMALNGTVLMDVIETAYNIDNCSYRYNSCNWSFLPISQLNVWAMNLNHFKNLFY